MRTVSLMLSELPQDSCILSRMRRWSLHRPICHLRVLLSDFLHNRVKGNLLLVRLLSWMIFRMINPDGRPIVLVVFLVFLLVARITWVTARTILTSLNE